MVLLLDHVREVLYLTTYVRLLYYADPDVLSSH